MTTLLFVKNDGLYADKRVVYNVAGDFKIKDEEKIIISEDKTFAYCFSPGTRLGNKIDMEEKIKKFLLKYKNHVELPADDDFHAEIGKHISESCIIVTKSGYGWIIDKKYGCSDLNYVDYAALGSGQSYALAFMRVTGDPLFTLSAINQMDGLSGGGYSRLKLDDLAHCDDFILDSEE